MNRYGLRLVGLAALVAAAGWCAGGCECRATSNSSRVEDEHRIRVKAPFTDVDIRVPKKDHDEHHGD